MRGKLIWTLLAVSIAANLFFIAGVVYSKATVESLAASDQARIDFVSEELGLSIEQRNTLEALRNSLRQRKNADREKRQERRQMFLATVANPTFDKEEVSLLLEQRCQARNKRWILGAEDLHGFLRELSDSQRQEFLEMAQERGFMRRLFFGRRGENKKQ